MGIYISGVKGLPEQVQKNKEDIKDLKERITTAEGTIGDQGDAITTLNDNLDNEINERKALIDLTEGDADIKKENVRIATIKSKSNVFDINVLGNSEDEAEFNINLINDGVQAHNLFFSTTGNLLIDGVPVGGGGKQLYLHRIRINSSNNFLGMLSIINDSNTPLNTYSTLATYIYNTYGSELTGELPLTGARYSSSVLYINYGIGASSTNSITIFSQNATSGSGSEYSLPSSVGNTQIYDNITAI